MESTRITLARVLELGVRVSWREATAIVHEAVAGTGATEGAGPASVTAESCLLTRGGDVVLLGTAAQAPPEVVVRLLDDLLASCSAPGRFAGAVANGTALDMLEELSEHITPRRRRVDVAMVALRGLAAAADAARAMAAADEPDPSADFDDVIAAPTPAASPPAVSRLWVRAAAPPSAPALGHAAVHTADLDHQDLIAAVETARDSTAPGTAVAALAIGTSPAPGSRPSVTLPASFSVDLPSATPEVNAVRTAKDVWGGYLSPFDWVKRASTAALAYSVLGFVGSILAVAASGFLVLQIPATQRSAVEPSEPAIAALEIDAPVGRDGDTLLPRGDPARLPKVPDPLSVPPLVTPSAPRDSRIVEASFVPSIPLPARRPETPAENTATVAGSGSLSTTSAAAAILASDAANLSAGAPSPAVDRASDIAGPSAAVPLPAETLGSASTAVPAKALARPPDRDAEARAIENVLGQYRTAFNTLDAGAASAVWPTVNEKTLAKAFERLESHDVSFESCQIEIFSVLAEAACSGNARYVPKVGSRTPKEEARRWKFSLRKASDGWLIDSVDAR